MFLLGRDNTRVDLGLRVDTFGIIHAWANYWVRRVGYTHSGGWGTRKMISFPRMARVFGAPRGRRVETELLLPSNTTIDVVEKVLTV